MDEFNDVLSKNDLSEEQLNICRDIRRRGKNKVGKCFSDLDRELQYSSGCSSELQAEKDRADRGAAW